MHIAKARLGRWSLVLAATLGAGIVATTNQASAQRVSAARSYSKATNQYVIVKKSGYNFWGNFNWSKKLHYSKNYLNHTLQVKRIYYKSNGSKYYSTYLGGKWFGYVNATGTSTTKTAQGAGVATSKYAIMNKSGWKTYSGFNWKTNHYTKNYLKHTFQVKRTYYHANGSTYYSLYRGGKWFGYINATALTSTTKKQGNAVKPAKNLSVYLNNLDKFGYHQDKVWRDLNFKKSVYANRTPYPIEYTVKAIYYHSNGYTYYSLYEGNKWIGYTNAKNATTQEFTEGEIVAYFETQSGAQIDLVASDGDTGSTIDFAGQVPAGYEAVGNTKFVVEGGKGQVETIVVQKLASAPTTIPTNNSNQSTGSTPVTVANHKVTVTYKDNDGKTLKSSVGKTVADGTSYTATAPQIDGYTLSGSPTKTITVNNDSTISFTYKKNAAPTVNKEQVYAQLEAKIFAGINAFRVQNGKKALTGNLNMQNAANQRAVETVVKYDHSNAAGQDYMDVAIANGWLGDLNENIMHADWGNSDADLSSLDLDFEAEAIVQSWIDSPAHRATMLWTNADTGSVGVSSGNDGETGEYILTFVFEIGYY